MKTNQELYLDMETASKRSPQILKDFLRYSCNIMKCFPDILRRLTVKPKNDRISFKLCFFFLFALNQLYTNICRIKMLHILTRQLWYPVFLHYRGLLNLYMDLLGKSKLYYLFPPPHVHCPLYPILYLPCGLKFHYLSCSHGMQWFYPPFWLSETIIPSFVRAAWCTLMESDGYFCWQQI